MKNLYQRTPEIAKEKATAAVKAIHRGAKIYGTTKSVIRKVAAEKGYVVATPAEAVEIGLIEWHNGEPQPKRIWMMDVSPKNAAVQFISW